MCVGWDLKSDGGERQIGREEGGREGKRHSSGDLDIFGHNKSKQRDSWAGD